MNVSQLLSRITVLLLVSAVMLAACGGSKWEAMEDDVLAAKSAECMGVGDPGAAMIQVCKNVTRECERRRANGIFAC